MSCTLQCGYIQGNVVTSKAMWLHPRQSHILSRNFRLYLDTCILVYEQCKLKGSKFALSIYAIADSLHMSWVSVAFSPY